mgnify:CR=1 FL=1
MSQPTLSDARALLQRVFGHADFRGLQADVISEVLAGRDAVAVLPTGGGKSFCYQIPAMLREGVGLVTIRDLLGHRQITSTQIYLHVTAQDLRMAADRHPIGRLLGAIEHLLPDVKLPVQFGRRRSSG